MSQSEVTKATNVLLEIVGERQRQIVKGFTHKSDDYRADGALPLCAAMIADPSGDLQERSATSQIRSWSEEGWEAERAEHVCGKHTRRRQLIIAAAMLVAEIERIDRAAR